MHLTSLRGREVLGTQAQINAEYTVSIQTTWAGTVGCSAEPGFHTLSACGSAVGTTLLSAGMFKVPWGSSI